ncbi:MAG: hypothetical protein KBC57_05795 [Neisseriaceae bacterium]|nr:hypothetical protein [Neisseriaceae bacterium]MBP6861853.1 hypothetical protein [Neisseriaceae bacterium]
MSLTFQDFLLLLQVVLPATLALYLYAKTLAPSKYKRMLMFGLTVLNLGSFAYAWVRNLFMAPNEVNLALGMTGLLSWSISAILIGLTLLHFITLKTKNA